MPCPVLSFFPSSDRASAVRSAAFETSSKLPVRGKPLMCTTAFFKLNAVVDIVLPCPVFHGRTESEMRIGRRQSGDAEDGLQLIQLSCGRPHHSSLSCPFRFCFFRCGAFSSPAEQASAPHAGTAPAQKTHMPRQALGDHGNCTGLCVVHTGLCAVYLPPQLAEWQVWAQQTTIWQHDVESFDGCTRLHRHSGAEARCVPRQPKPANSSQTRE